MIADARKLAEGHAVPLAALGHGEAAQLLDGERVADVVQHRRDVVEPVDVREHLGPRAALAHLLEAAVQVADLHVGLHDRLAGELEHDAHGAVHRGMRRPHVQVHGLRGELELAFFEVEVERFHRSIVLASPVLDARQVPQIGTAEGHPLVGSERLELAERDARLFLGAVRDERLRPVRRVVLAGADVPRTPGT